MIEGVHSHVMDLLQKSDFAPLNFLVENYHRISDFGPDSYFELKLKSGAKLDLGT